MGRLRSWLARSKPAAVPLAGPPDPAEAATLLRSTGPHRDETPHSPPPAATGPDDPSDPPAVDLRCAEVLGVLQAYLDGEADEAMAHQVTAHLACCPPCDQELILYRRIKVSLHTRRHDIDPRIHQSLSDFLDRVVQTDGSP
ncbi:MAG: anti-sigma factor family protein [Acidimicrobiales bacterium]